jgi:hypothetical protein
VREKRKRRTEKAATMCERVKEGERGVGGERGHFMPKRMHGMD